MKNDYTKEEVINLLSRYVNANVEKSLPAELCYLIVAIEMEFSNFHIANIQKQQAELTKLWQDENKFLAIWNGDKDSISPGCRSCLYESIAHVRHSGKCSQNCSFCYYRHQPEGSNPKNLVPKNTYYWSFDNTPPFTLEEMKMYVDKQSSSGVLKIDAVGWLQKEPLMELKSLQPLMRYIAEKGIHQYLYTNGVFADKETLKIVADCGLNEIRFNLEATSFSHAVINRMAYAKKLIDWVLIESPIYSKSFNNFKSNINRILDTGLNQINMAELQICHPKSADEFIASEGMLYKHRRGYISPASSRYYTYALIKQADDENWPIIINDCSNDTKYFRGAHTDNFLGVNNYGLSWQLRIEDVIKLAKVVFADGFDRKFL